MSAGQKVILPEKEGSGSLGESESFGHWFVWKSGCQLSRSDQTPRGKSSHTSSSSSPVGKLSRDAKDFDVALDRSTYPTFVFRQLGFYRCDGGEKRQSVRIICRWQSSKSASYFLSSLFATPPRVDIDNRDKVTTLLRRVQPFLAQSWIASHFN